jgi:predicted RNA-binding protein with TRAM domain
MVEIPDRLECLFSVSLDQHGDSYHIEIPRADLEHGAVRSGETYRVAVLPSSPQNSDTATRQQDGSAPPSGAAERAPQPPPVAEGDVREVSIETIGDQGDGIAKVERGYVVIVPEAETGDEVIVEITHVRENVAFAQVRDNEGENISDASVAPEESVKDDTLGEKG